MKSPLAISRTIRHVKRSHEILAALIGYGFEDVVHELGLDRLVEKTRSMLPGTRSPREIKHLPQEVRLRKVMEELGPTFVKLGQVLSMRPDLIPPKWAKEFEKLQDEVPPVPYEHIRERLEEEFSDGVDKVFQSIEQKPVAAASIAQVHRAVLVDGTNIVIKVLRPGVREVLEIDMQIIRALAAFAEDHFQDLGYSPTEVADVLAKELNSEVDLLHEARATERLRTAFYSNSNVSFPKVYWQATTRSVLALEEIHGVLLSKRKPDQLSKEELRNVVAHGTDAVFRQCLEIGFFHADPHPGNIFVLPGGKICFIDCGMVGHVEPATTGHLADLVHAVINADLERVLDVVIALGDVDPAIKQDRNFRADAWEFIGRFENVTLETLDMGDLLQDFFERIRRNNLRVPSDIVFLIKAITTIESIGERLMPEFNIVQHVRPHIDRLVRRRYGVSALRQRVQDTVLSYASLLEDLPSQFKTIFWDLRRDRFTVNLEHHGLEEMRRTIEHASGNIGHAVFVGSLILGSAILILADSIAGERGALSIIAGIGFSLAVVLAAWRALSSRFFR